VLGSKYDIEILRISVKHFGPPQVIATEKPRPYGAALKVVGNADRQETGRWLNNRAEKTHLRVGRREWAMLRLRGMRSLQKLWPSTPLSSAISIRNVASIHVAISS
jgi:putative transposase